MSDDDLKKLHLQPNVTPWRLSAARAVESPLAQRVIIALIIANAAILGLFIGIIVSTTTELSTLPDPRIPDSDLPRIIERMENNLKDLRAHVERR